MQNRVNILKMKMRVITRYAAATAILVLMAFGVNFIPVSTASGTGSGLLIEKIIENRDFFVGLDGYDGDLLCDVNGELGESSGSGNEKIGLLLLDSSGLLKSLVFDRNALKKIHEDASIPPKKVRADLANSAISVSDARLIARNIAGLRTEPTGKSPRRKTVRRETQRREAGPHEVMPQSLPAGFVPENARKNTDSEEILERLRRDVESNPNVAAMTSEEILERFRSNIANTRQKEAKPIP